MNPKFPSSNFLKKSKAICGLIPRSQLRALQKSIELLSHNHPIDTPANQLKGQPFDSHLLTLSKLYRKSRRLFHQLGGQFEPALLSSERTLSSDSLLTQRIEYSPLEAEMIWVATDPIEKKKPESLFRLRAYCTHVFHEQNHRILWDLLPPPPSSPSDLRMYLNFAESLVIMADWALADELGAFLGTVFHLVGVLYHPGTHAHQELRNTRNYRNYLHAMTYATYLNLELFDEADIQKATRHLYSNVYSKVDSNIHPLMDHALGRSLQLDRNFIEKTNPFWQNRHRKNVRYFINKLKLKNKNKNKNSSAPPLKLPSDPLDNRLLYLWTERWMDTLNLTLSGSVGIRFPTIH